MNPEVYDSMTKNYSKKLNIRRTKVDKAVLTFYFLTPPVSPAAACTCLSASLLSIGTMMCRLFCQADRYTNSENLIFLRKKIEIARIN